MNRGSDSNSEAPAPAGGAVSAGEWRGGSPFAAIPPPPPPPPPQHEHAQSHASLPPNLSASSHQGSPAAAPPGWPTSPSFRHSPAATNPVYAHADAFQARRNTPDPFPISSGAFGNGSSSAPPANAPPRRSPVPVPAPAPRHTPTQDSDKMYSPAGLLSHALCSLVFLVIDFLKRKGLLASASQLIGESRIDPKSSETAEMVHIVNLITNIHGRDPQPSGADYGFLRDWWSTFWSIYQAKIPGQMKQRLGTAVASSASAAVHRLNDPPPRSDDLAQQQAQAALASRRAILLSALHSVGLGGRDMQSLNPDEQRLLSLAIHQQTALRMQIAGVPLQSPKMHSNPPAQPASEMSFKKARTEHAFSGSAPVSTNSPAQLAELSQQQILQLRIAQMQQQQQHMMQMIMSGNTLSQQYSRPLMPIPSAATPGAQAAAPAKPAAKPPKTKTDPSGRPAKASPVHQNAPAAIDDTSLLSYFGTPSDWFQQLGEGGVSASAAGLIPTVDWRLSSMPPVDQFGNIQAGSSLISEFSAKSRKLHSRGAHSPTDASALRIETAFEGADTGSSGQARFADEIAVPHAEAGIPDSSDLLLVGEKDVGEGDEGGEGRECQIASTDSGYFLQGLCALGQHQSGSKAVTAAFSQDGALLASGGHDRRVLVFSMHSRELLFALDGHAQQITQVRFCPSGASRLLATASFDKTIQIWDLGAPSEHHDAPGAPDPRAQISKPEAPLLVMRDVHDEPVWSIDFIPAVEGGTCPRLCSIDASGKLALWDLQTGLALYTTTVETGNDRAVTVRQIKAHSSILAITNGSNVEVFDCNSTCFIGSLVASTAASDQKAKPVVAINWGDASAPDLLITATMDSVRVWDMAPILDRTGAVTAPLATQMVPADKITCCSLIRDLVIDSPGPASRRKRLAVFGGYQSIYMWEWEFEGAGRSGNPSATPIEERLSRLPVKFSAHEGLVVSLPATKSGALLLGSASHDGWVKLWHLGRTTRNPYSSPLPWTT